MAVTEQIKELQLVTREIGGVLWGDDKTRNNGLRAKVGKHEERLDTIEPIVTDTAKKLDAHLSMHEKMDKSMKELQTATLQMRAAITVAMITAIASVVTAIIMAVWR